MESQGISPSDASQAASLGWLSGDLLADPEKSVPREAIRERLLHPSLAHLTVRDDVSVFCHLDLEW